MVIGREIKESWPEIKVMEADGSFMHKYKPGDYKAILVGTDLIRMRIAGFNKDHDADRRVIPVSWIAADLTTNKYQMHNDWFGEYSKCDLRKQLNGDLFDRLPDDLKAAIVPTLKRQVAYKPTWDCYTDIVVDKLWIPSFGEVFEGGYPDLFSDNDSRAMVLQWWLRSANTNYTFLCVTSSGSTSGSNANGSYALALGFST